jgi:hypothetical protein
VRREAGEEYEVKVLYGEGSHRTGPEPCAADREVGGEASGGGRHRPAIEPRKTLIPGADDVPVSEGDAGRRDCDRTARPGVV